MSGETMNDRVTNKQLYEVVRSMEKDTGEKLVDMERRITDKLEPIAVACSLIVINKEEIDKLRTRTNIFGGANAVFAILAGFFGVKT